MIPHNPPPSVAQLLQGWKKRNPAQPAKYLYLNPKDPRVSAAKNAKVTLQLSHHIAIGSYALSTFKMRTPSPKDPPGE